MKIHDQQPAIDAMKTFGDAMTKAKTLLGKEYQNTLKEIETLTGNLDEAGLKKLQEKLKNELK